MRLKLRYFLLMLMITFLCCIGNVTPVAASSTSNEDSQVITVTTPEELVVALGGDVSWVDGNTIMFERFEFILNKEIRIESGEYILKSKPEEGFEEDAEDGISPYRIIAESENAKITVNGGSITIMNAIITTENKGQVVFMVNDGTVNIESSSLYNFSSTGGNTTISKTDIGHYNEDPTAMWISGGHVLLHGVGYKYFIYDGIGKAIEYSGGLMEVDENTMLITLEADYTSEDVIPQGTISQAIIVDKKYIKYEEMASVWLSYDDKNQKYQVYVSVNGGDYAEKIGMLIIAETEEHLANQDYSGYYSQNLKSFPKIDLSEEHVIRFRVFERNWKGTFGSYSKLIEKRIGDGGTVIDASSLALALGGDDSWVDGNEVTIPGDVYLTGSIDISGSGLVLNLNNNTIRRCAGSNIVIKGEDITIKNGSVLVYDAASQSTDDLVVDSGGLNLINCILYSVKFSNADVTISDSKLYDPVEIHDGNLTISGSDIVSDLVVYGGSTTISDSNLKSKVTVQDGSILISDSNVESELMVKTGNTEISACSVYGLWAYGGDVTVSDCDFHLGMTVSGGNVLLKGTDVIRRIGKANGCTAYTEYGLRYYSGNLQTDENTVLITTVGDYDIDNPISGEVIGAAFVAAKDAVTYYDAPQISSGFTVNTTGCQGIWYVCARTKSMVTDFGVKYYASFEEEDYIYGIHSDSNYDAYYAARTYIERNGKIILVSRPAEIQLDLSIYPPRNVKVTSTDYTTVKISWQKSPDAKGYQIYRSMEKDGKYTRIADIKDTNITEYLDTTVVTEFKYYYKVRNVIETGENADYSPFSSPLIVNAKLETQVLETSSADYKSIKVTWSKVPGASGYTVYRLNSKGKEEVIKTVFDGDILSYIDTGRKTNKEYTYRVRAFRDVGDIRIYGAKTKPCIGMALVGAPIISTSAESYNKIKIFWKSVPGAEGYCVYRATTSDGEYTLIKDITNKDTLSYIDTGRTCGKNYYYKVQSYYVVTNEGQDGLSSDEKIDGETSAFVSGKSLPSAPTITVKKSSSTSAKITWKKVSGADGYQIYTYDRNKKKYVLLDTVGTDVRTYTAKGLTKGVKHYFKVRAYKTVNEKKVNGAFSEIVKVAF